MKSELIVRHNDAQNARSYYLVSSSRRMIIYYILRVRNVYDGMKYVLPICCGGCSVNDKG